MPAALPLSMREEIVRRHQHGETFRQIARELKVSYAATRRIWARFTQEGDLKPHYDRCPPARPIDRDDPRLAGLQSAGTDGLTRLVIPDEAAANLLGGNTGSWRSLAS
ncbi:MAG: helix-turn-helix domain-containing protein [Anaerolineae bacterium]|nr:helix-turn-helix domain-containing protein [Anaerolineae bacterium]